MNERLFCALAQFGLENIAASTDLINGAENTLEFLPF